MSVDARERLVRALYQALRAMRLGGVGSTARKQRALRELRSAIDDLAASSEGGDAVDVVVVRRTLYVSGQAIPNRVDNFVFLDHVIGKVAGAGVGSIAFDGPPEVEALDEFLALILRHSAPVPRPGSLGELRASMRDQGIRGITVDVAPTGGPGLPGEVERREAAKRTYEESVAVAKDLFTGARMGRSAEVTQVKQAVQRIVDGVLVDEASLGGLSTLKDYDDYAFVHAVNVCIFCVAIGRRLGLNKGQLYDLGHAALVHDIGMSRIPREILTKGSELEPDERKQMEAHTWLGALSVFQLRDFGEVPLQSMLVSYEHHLKPDGGGYPTLVRARTPSVFAKIIAVAAAFDAATNERAYSKARPADEVLRELWESPDLGLDPVVVKALINLLGIYPVGTVVILDTYELALVHSANSDPSFVHRPVVRILSDADGRWLEPTELVDLSDTREDGTFSRSIIKVTDPARYGIRVSEYFA